MAHIKIMGRAEVVLVIGSSDRSQLYDEVGTTR